MTPVQIQDGSEIVSISPRETSVQEFLDLTDVQVYIIDLKNDLAEEIKDRRKAAKLTQAQVAAMAGIQQPQLAAIESGREGASLDLLFRILLSMGVSTRELGDLLQAE
jgi:DNA-binding XRE family transcriptional regulator